MSVGVSVSHQVSGGKSTVRIVLLHDSQGKVLALLPSNYLLNLAGVWKHSGRHLQPVRGADAERFFGQPALRHESGLEKLFSLPVFIDMSLSEQRLLTIVEPHSSLTFHLPAQWLHDKATFSQFALSKEQIAENQPQGDDRAVITQAVEKFTALRIRQRLEDTLGLPALSPTVQKIVMLRSDPDASVDDLVPVVKVDPSLSAQVMSWSVSPYYAAPGKVQSIEDAIIRVLGYDLVVNLALGVTLGKTMEVPDDTPRGSIPYWLQTVYTATLAEKLSKKIPLEIRPNPGLTYLSGLLHNFGYLVLAHLFPPHFSLLSRYIEANPHMEASHIEKQVLNVSREQVGAWLLESWQLPEEVCHAVRYQNDVDADSPYITYARLIHLTDRLLREKGLSDGPTGEDLNGLIQQLGLTPAIVTEVMEAVLAAEDELHELTQIFAG